VGIEEEQQIITRKGKKRRKETKNKTCPDPEHCHRQLVADSRRPVVDWNPPAKWQSPVNQKPSVSSTKHQQLTLQFSDLGVFGRNQRSENYTT